MEKVLDTREYVAALREIVEQGGEAGMTIWGSSMAPFLIHGRDRIFFPRRTVRCAAVTWCSTAVTAASSSCTGSAA